MPGVPYSYSYVIIDFHLSAYADRTSSYRDHPLNCHVLSHTAHAMPQYLHWFHNTC
jgi:hypothetical protein